MQSKFAAKRVGTLNKFFTKVSVGEMLVELIDIDDPTNLIDLGAGEGSLSEPAVQRWPSITVVTVDLDPSTGCTLHENLKLAGCALHQHHVHDAMDPLLTAVLGAKGAFDLAVCNPPFFKPPWSRNFADILQKADMEDACRSITEVTAEILFLAQSLTLLKEGGRLAIIVPDSLVTTRRAKNFRRALLRKHTVEKVVQLPLNSFRETDAQCFIVVLRKGSGPTRKFQLLDVEVDQSLSQPIWVGGQDAEDRMDYNYHSLRSNRSEKHTTLRELGADVFRGSISTVQRKTADYPVFHTSDYKLITDGLIELSDSSTLSHTGKVVAETGDILMARVDRNLHEKIGLVMSGSAVVTDCIYRIRLPEKHRALAYNALCSKIGRANLKALTKGVGARIIGKADLLDMPLYSD